MKRIIGALCLLLTFAGCSYYTRVSNQNLFFTYRKEFNTLHPAYSVFHVNDTSTLIYYDLKWSEFLFIKPPTEQVFSAFARLSWKLTDGYDSNLIKDSSHVKLTHTSTTAGSDETEDGFIIIPFRKGSAMLLELTLLDINRNQLHRHFINLEKLNEHTRQNFLIKENGRPLMSDYVTRETKLRVIHRNTTNKELFVRYYAREFPLAPPPFSEHSPKPFLYKADSLFKIPATEDGTFELTVSKVGFYHLQTDSSTKNGYTIFRVHDDYPDLTTAEALINPLRYITSKKEYEEMIIHADKKAMIDQFWLNNGGNNVRARELIKTFYNRVKDANLYFHSYLEGWKTDRGLLFIIYGPPSAVYRTSNSETWVYGEENNIRSLHFTFVKVQNPFTDNDYSLVRNENYKDSWYIAVDTWRQGRVFSD